jgi:hypothetical protein
MATPSYANKLIIVVAGKQVPDPSRDWEPYCFRMKLPPLRLEDWKEYASIIGSNRPPEEIEAICDKHFPIAFWIASSIERVGASRPGIEIDDRSFT